MLNLIDIIDSNVMAKYLNKICGFQIHSKDQILFIKLNMKDAFYYAHCFYSPQTYTFQYHLKEDEYHVYYPPKVNRFLSLNKKGILDYDKQISLINNQKFLIPIEVPKSQAEACKEKFSNNKVVKLIQEYNLNPEDCYITEIYLKTKGYSLENYIEYLTCKIFIEKGYIVENQPIFTDLGYDINIKNPDFCAFKIPEIQNLLRDYGFIRNGAFIQELALLRLFGKPAKMKNLNNQVDDFIIGEAKTASAGHDTYITQVKQYYNSGFFHKFLQITPKNPRIQYWYQYLDFKEDSSIDLIIPEEKKEIHKDSKIELLKNALIQKIKNYLIQNLYFDELLEITNNKIGTLYGLYKKLSNLELTRILDYVENLIE